MNRSRLCLLLGAIVLVGSARSMQQPSPPVPQPQQDRSIQRFQEFMAARDDAECRAENRALGNELQIAGLYFTFGIGTGVGLTGSLCVLGLIFRKRLAPKTARGKQISVLMLAALWCSICAIGSANDVDLMAHPINAAVTALLWSLPALFFGAIAFWWFSHEKIG